MAELREDLRRRKGGFQVAGEGLQTIGAILGGRAVPQFQEADAELSFLEKEEIKQQIKQENLEAELAIRTQNKAAEEDAVLAQRRANFDQAQAAQNAQSQAQQGLRTTELANTEKEAQLTGAGISVPQATTSLTGQPVGIPQQGAPISSGVGESIPQAGLQREFERLPGTQEFNESRQRFEDVPGKLQETIGSEITGQAVQAQAVERAKQDIKADISFNKVAGLMQGLVSQFKLKREQQGGRAGLIPGLVGKARTTFRDPSASGIAAFEGQRNETAFALNSIITGQNRVIKGVLKLILDTIPDDLDPDENVAQKIAQTVNNAFSLKRGIEASGISTEVLEGLSPDQVEDLALPVSPEQREALQPLIQEILDTPIAKEQSFNFGSENQSGNLESMSIEQLEELARSKGISV